MTRNTLAALTMVLGLGGGLAAVPAAHASSVDLHVRIGDAPPAPAFVFEDEPEVILVPSTRVYYVPGLEFDLFRYGRYWYINRGGWWYRARSYRGPFVYLEYGNVPSPIIRVPAKFHRHPLGGPPGQTGYHPNKGYRYKDRGDYDDDRGRGKKKGWH